jgi:3-dehydroquinate synthase
MIETSLATALKSSAAFKRITVDFSSAASETSYDIVIGDGVLGDAGALIAERLGKRRCVVISDSNVAPLYGQRLEAVMSASGHTLLPSIIVAAGESSKDFVTLQNVLEKLLKAGVDRKTLVIALGGGVTGDLAGVAASLVLRGIDVVQIPTTLLAQVDSSVGGKTGINTSVGKNTVGAFYQPRLVIIDVTVLDSLSPREILSGYAEVVKYGLIKDPAFFKWCCAHAGELLHGNRAAQIHAVSVSCAHKANIVAADEREAGERALLNLGHTFGHALETATGYGTLLMHGEAVAIGTVMAFKLSAQMGLCSHADAHAVRDHFAAVGLPIKPPPFVYDIDSLMSLMAQDKKATAGKLTLILAHGIGRSFVAHDVNEKEVRTIWQEFVAA